MYYNLSGFGYSSIKQVFQACKGTFSSAHTPIAIINYTTHCRMLVAYAYVRIVELQTTEQGLGPQLN